MPTSVQPFFHADSCTWTYLVWDGDARRAAVIDPVLDFDPKSGTTATHGAAQVLQAIRDRDLQVDWILETHAHADHLSAGQWFRQHCPSATLAIGSGIRAVQRTFRTIFHLGERFAVDGSQFDRLFEDDARFMLGHIEGRVIATPGHTSDSVSYLIGDALFVGDTLFLPDVGSARCDFPGGSAAVLYRSVRRIYSLPADTRVFVCHDYAPDGREPRCETTIAAQRAGNIHVRDGVTESDYVALREARDATLELPALLLPSLQVNIRAGAMPEAEANGVSYLKLPLNQFGTRA